MQVLFLLACFKQLKFEYDVIQDSNRYITPPRLRLVCVYLLPTCFISAVQQNFVRNECRDEIQVFTEEGN